MQFCRQANLVLLQFGHYLQLIDFLKCNFLNYELPLSEQSMKTNQKCGFLSATFTSVVRPITIRKQTAAVVNTFVILLSLCYKMVSQYHTLLYNYVVI